MRPDAQIFVHVLAAITLFGATGAVAVLAFAARGRDAQVALARASFWTLLLLGLPACVVTIVFGSWAESAGHWPEGLGWIDLGAGIADAGVLVLLASTGVAFRWMRRPDTGWAPTAIGILTALLLVGLAVAWWVMSAKVPT
jgi:hypothetical protein